MKKLRVVARNGKIVSDLELEKRERAEMPAPRNARPVAMLAIQGMDTQALRGFASAEGFTVDDDANEALVWDPKTAASDPWSQTAELMKFVIGIAAAIPPTTCLTLFCLDGSFVQLENGIKDLSAGIEQAARELLVDIKPREKGRLLLAHKTRDLLIQAYPG